MSRKLIRPALTGAPRSTPRLERGSSAPALPSEPGYLLQAIESKVPFVVRLLGGVEIRGRLEAYDADALAVREPAGQLRLVRKDHVAWYATEPRPGRSEPLAPTDGVT